MASTNALPQTNLKDRIAALQKLNADKNAGPNGPASGPPRGTLKDKIAKFEQRGGTPIPRGSFGMGAPPPDDGANKKKGELFGNRVPGLNRPTVPPALATGHPRRSASTSGLELNPADDETPPSDSAAPIATKLVAHKTGGAFPSTTSPKFDTATLSAMPNLGRRAASDSYASFTGTDVSSEPETATHSADGTIAIPSETLNSGPPSQLPPISSPPNDTDENSRKQSSESTSEKYSAPEPRPSPGRAYANPLSLASMSSMDTVTQSMYDGTASPHQSFDISRAEILTARSENVSPVNRAILVPVAGSRPSSPSVAPASTPPDVTPSPSPTPTVTSESKPNGDAQTKLRKKIYPNASTTSIPSAPASVTTATSFREPSLTPKEPTRKSFTAVVHRNTTNSYTTRKTSTESKTLNSTRINALANEGPAPPSPSATELTSLAAEAALLEKQLGLDTWSFPTEFLDSESTIPLFTRPNSVSTPPVPELVRDDSSSGKTDPTQSSHSSYPVPTVREVSEDGDYVIPAVPFKESRTRKMSNKFKSLTSASTSTLRTVSSTHSRPSISSELSSAEGDDGAEDASLASARSSKFSLSPKSSGKGALSRASSFADKIMGRANKTKSAIYEDFDHTHLSPPRASTMSRRKTSHEKKRLSLVPSLPQSKSVPKLNLPEFAESSPMSNSPSTSFHSSFDVDIFDAFPSVPTEIPRSPSATITSFNNNNP